MRLILDTNQFEPAARFEVFRDDFVRRLFQLDLINRTQGPFRASVNLEAAGPALFGRIDGSSADFFRTSTAAGQCEPGVWLLINRSGALQLAQSEVAARLNAGDAMLGYSEDPHQGHCVGQTDTWIVQVNTESVRSLRAKHGERQTTILRGTEPTVRMMTGMLEAYFRNSDDANEQSAALFGQYLSDLMVLLLGANREGEVLIARRGLMMARRTAILEDIRLNARHPSYDVHEAARRLGLSLRYVYLLLEETGKSFSEHVIQRRLELARNALTDGSSHTKTIASIAFDCGFSDLSYFNRTFRARYGATPSEIRQTSFEQGRD